MAMMEYQVPQFIEVENKIVGPLTLKQFIYLAGAAGITVAAFAYLSFVIAFLVAAPFVALGVALSFYKVNGKPFIEMMEAAFSYYVGAKLFLWKHVEPKAPQAAQKKPETPAAPPLAGAAPRLTRGKLEQLAWSLDVQKPERKNQ